MNSKLKTFSICLAIFVLALGFRLFYITQESFFIDEVSTWKAAHTPAIEYALHAEVNPPLYFAMVRAWAFIMDSPDGLRVFSALTGALCAVFLLLAARKLGFSWPAAIACSLLAVANPMLVWYGQQARCYALLATLVAAWIWSVFWSLPRPHIARLIIVFGLLIVGFSVHYYFAFAVIGGAMFAAVAGLKNHAWRRIALTHLAAFTAWLAYLPLIRYQLTQNHISWIQRPRIMDLSKTYFDSFLLGPFHSLTPAIVGCLLALLLLLIYCILRALMSSPRIRAVSLSNPDALSLAFLIASALAPVMIPSLLSLGSHSFFLPDRYTIVALPAFLLAIVCVIDTIEIPQMRHIAMIGLMAVLLPLFVWKDIDYWNRCQDFDWRQSARMVEENWQDGDRLLFIPSWMGETFFMNSKRKDFPFIPLDLVPEHRFSRIWVFGWHGTPEANGKRFLEELASPLAEIAVDFPHIKLWLLHRESGQKRLK